jgi:protein-tyrosine phosphatase
MGSVIEVAVDRQPAGELTVSWDLDGEDSAVDVAVGPTPETVDHDHALTVPAGQRSAQLPDLGPGRHYISVSPHDGGAALVAAERRLPFEGALNFRDLGGYRTSGGGRTRWGKVFRADSLHQLTPSDGALFEGLGLRVIYDLRTDRERQERPDTVQEARSVWVPLIAATQLEAESLSERLRDGERFLLEVYQGMVANSAQAFGELLSGLTASGGLPAVFHCAAGKDRTGMTAAILLSVLGVSEDDVLHDYELTSRHRTEERRVEIMSSLEQLGLAPEIAAGLLSTPRWVMETVLDTIATTYGSVEGYLLGPVGMSRETIEVLRRLLVVVPDESRP